MATTTTMVKVPCGRCAGTGRYGGTVCGGICFACRGTKTVLITAAAFIAQRNRENAAAAHQAEQAKRIITADRKLCGHCMDTGVNTETGNPCRCYQIPGYREQIAREAAATKAHLAARYGH